MVPPTEPIEILFLDILKTQAIGDFAARHFFTRLLPGVSIVVEQDYFSAEAPWLSCLYEHFAAHLEYLGEIQSSAVFRCVTSIPAAAAEAFVREKPPAVEQIRNAEQAMARTTDPNRRFMLALAKLQVVAKVAGADAARAYLATIPGDFPEQTGNTRWKRLRDVWSQCRAHAEAGTLPSY